MWICLYPRNKIYLASRNNLLPLTHIHQSWTLVLDQSPPLTHPIACNPHKVLTPLWNYSLLNLIVDTLRNHLQMIGLAPIKVIHHWMTSQLLPQGQRTLVTFRRRLRVLSQTRPHIDLQLGARASVAQSSIMVYILLQIHFYTKTHVNLCSCNLTNEPREKSRYRKTTIGRTCHSCQYAKCIHSDPRLQVSLFQFQILLIATHYFWLVALTRYYHMHLLQIFNTFQNPNMLNNTFLRTEQDSYLEGECQWSNSWPGKG